MDILKCYYPNQSWSRTSNTRAIDMRVNENDIDNMINYWSDTEHSRRKWWPN